MDIKRMIAEMTLEEKSSLMSGANSWDTQEMKRVGLPKITMSDGPHGLRRQDNYEGTGMEETVSIAQGHARTVTTRTAIGWPTASALAASFDRGLLRKLGGLLGDECLANDTQVLLGPGVNIKRSPLCGRNFEYFSEDPFLSGELAAAYISGLQEKGVSACVKHFAANSQEFRRMTVNSVVSERALREIYLPAFEAAVRGGGTKSIMCSYNLINGVYACENTWLLADVLRKEWGFDGIVMSDWGAMNDRVKAICAGLELEMPASGGINDQKLVEAVRNGALDEAILDRAAERLLVWIAWCLEHKKAVGINLDEHHTAAADIAAQCAVLLKNEGALLPLKQNQKIVFIGSFARSPRIQGGGSSHIINYKIDSALEAVKGYADVQFVEMFNEDRPVAAQWQQAIDAAKAADVAVIFAGLPDSYESEGFDRRHLDLPDCQNEAIAAIAAVQKNTAVLLQTGSPVVLPWLNEVKAVLNLYLAGEGAGTAAVQLLFGTVNPSGKLAETYPLRLEDTPAYPDYGKSRLDAVYGEGIYVGYRHYDVRKLDVLFPFGYGLSYTDFALSNLRLSSAVLRGDMTITVCVDVTDTGAVAGAEVMQVYVGFNGEDTVGRPLRELKGFDKVFLQPGESKSVSIPLDRRAFSYYETRIQDWYAEAGEYTVFAGTSSRDLPLTASVTVISEPLPLPDFPRITVADLVARAETAEEQRCIYSHLGNFGAGLNSLAGEAGRGAMVAAMMDAMPLHSVKSFAAVSEDKLRKLAETL